MSQLTYTPLEEIDKIHAHLRTGFKSGKFTSIAYRKYQLTQLVYLLKDNITLFEETLKKDMGRPVLESRFLEISPTIAEVLTQIKNVEKWSKPSRPPFSFNFFPMRPLIRKEPKGVVLIISPFNYPIFLTLGPLAGAIAAGNAVAIKAAESTPATTALMAKLAEKYLDKDLVRFIHGAVPETTRVLELQWDHILFTGKFPSN
jgi:aldehyde dehydrogenase (NAD+)